MNHARVHRASDDPTESRSEFSTWAETAAPLIDGGHLSYATENAVQAGITATG
ncbi:MULTISPECIES: hypothetical protein [Streptomyces violaceusniger group]|uniref:Uncharacterized protein n=2 Tax=Streptomyces rhizosphaericus TaxID=114699 RepID=A0ABN1SCE3_9ACTN|nr:MULTISPECIES: hypothetical protein [Streptomyces violaceusniger group]